RARSWTSGTANPAVARPELEQVCPLYRSAAARARSRSATTSIPSSSSCSCSTGVGAPDIGSTPAWFFGNASVSRMNGSSSSAIERRSIPDAIPPGRGAPLGGVAGAEQRRRPRLAQRVERLLRQELRDRRADLAVGAEDDVREPLRAPALRKLLEPLHLAARELAGHLQVPHGLRVREYAEL